MDARRGGSLTRGAEGASNRDGGDGGYYRSGDDDDDDWDRCETKNWERAAFALGTHAQVLDDTLFEDSEEEALANARRRAHRRGRWDECGGFEGARGKATKFGVLERGGRDERVATRREAEGRRRRGGGGGGGGGETTAKKTKRQKSGSGRVGLGALADIGACEMLVRERVTKVEGTFEDEAGCLAALVKKLVATGDDRESHGPRPKEDWRMILTTDEADAVMRALASIDITDYDEFWLDYAAFVKHNAVTRQARPFCPDPGDKVLYKCSMVMFDVISACNHSCDPNAEISDVNEAGEVTLYSLRPIEAGEEITICYGKQMLRWLPRRIRQQVLGREWGFDCACHRCAMELAGGFGERKQPSKAWDLHDPRWFYCPHDYVTGFESHFDPEGELFVLRFAGDGKDAAALGEDFGSMTIDADDSANPDKGAADSTDVTSDSTFSSSEDLDDFEADHTSSGSEDEDVVCWHERWRSKRLHQYSVKSKGLLSPLQLYLAMQRCQIRQDHWQFVVVRDALIFEVCMHEALKKKRGYKERPLAPTIGGNKFRAFKLILNQCRSLSRVTPNTSYFSKIFATLENIHYWHALEGTHARTRAGARMRRRSCDSGSPVRSTPYFSVSGRWDFRIENLRDAVHPDVMAWNFRFGKSPNAPF